MEFSAKQIAEFLQGEIVGDPDAKVNNVSKIEILRFEGINDIFIENESNFEL